MSDTEIVVTQGTADKLWYYGNENTDSWTGPFDTREEAEKHLADLRQRFEEFKKRIKEK